MALTRHQRHHVTAMLADVPDLPAADRGRVAQVAADLLNGTTGWPDPDLQEDEIHDWIEQPDTRAARQAVLARRRIARGG